MWAYRDDRRVDTGTKRNGSMKPEFERLSRRGGDRLERRLESEALSRREIGAMEMSWIFYSGEPCLFPDGNFSLGPGIRTLSFLANACMIGSWPFVILSTASVIENHAARSTSGTSTVRPDFGGHSAEHVLLLNSTGSKSRSIAQAEISFPLGCLNVPNSKNSPHQGRRGVTLR